MVDVSICVWTKLAWLKCVESKGAQYFLHDFICWDSIVILFLSTSKNQDLLIWEKKKVFIKRSLHGENRSLSFIEAVHQWLWKMPHQCCPPVNERNSVSKCQQFTIDVPKQTLTVVCALLHYQSKVTQIRFDLCFDIIYQHSKFELNRCSLSKVIERTPNFDNGRTHVWTGVTLNAPPPFFEWRGHNKWRSILYYIIKVLKNLNRGVCFMKSVASISAPWSRSSFTVVAWPDNAAACRAARNSINYVYIQFMYLKICKDCHILFKLH